MTDSDNTHLMFSQGWLELGDLASARQELENIEPAHRDHPDVLNIKWDISNQARTHQDAIDVARLLVQKNPEAFEGWWKLSYSLHELKRTEEAYQNLASVRDQFGSEWLLHYNLACYLARLSRLDEARLHLKQALTLNPNQRADALNDPDLRSLHAEIRR